MVTQCANRTLILFLPAVLSFTWDYLIIRALGNVYFVFWMFGLQCEHTLLASVNNISIVIYFTLYYWETIVCFLSLWPSFPASSLVPDLYRTETRTRVSFTSPNRTRVPSLNDGWCSHLERSLPDIRKGYCHNRGYLKRIIECGWIESWSRSETKLILSPDVPLG
jgi:hypothetical protein